VVNAAVLFILLRKRLGLMGGKRILTTLLKSLTASVLMGLAAVAVIRSFDFTLYLRVPLAVTVGMGLYVLFAHWLKMEERRPFMELILRRPAAAEAP